MKFLRSKQKLDFGFWQNLFRGVWAEVASTIGVSNVRVVLDHALDESKYIHPCLNSVKIKDDGIWLDNFIKDIKTGGIEEGDAQLALRIYLTKLLEVLSRLSGPVISERVCGLILKMGEKQGLKKDDVLSSLGVDNAKVCFSFDFKR